MYGAILGDIFGSIYEWRNRKTDNPDEIDLLDPRCQFTDDTTLTVAIAEAALGDRDYRKAVLDWANRYPDVGYGPSFAQWFRQADPQPYNSWGNGSAMRVSSIGWVSKTLDEAMSEAKRSAEFTHNHPEGIKGAQAVAVAVFLASINSKEDIRTIVEETFGYDLSRTIAEIRPGYEFDVSCQGSVPVAIRAFLESRDFAHAIQLAISVGGDSDTIACITGGIAEAFYREIPDEYIRFAHDKLPEDMRQVIHQFCWEYTQADRPAVPEPYRKQDEKRNEKKRRREEERKRLEDERKRWEEETAKWHEFWGQKPQIVQETPPAVTRPTKRFRPRSRNRVGLIERLKNLAAKGLASIVLDGVKDVVDYQSGACCYMPAERFGIKASIPCPDCQRGKADLRLEEDDFTLRGCRFGKKFLKQFSHKDFFALEQGFSNRYNKDEVEQEKLEQARKEFADGIVKFIQENPKYCDDKLEWEDASTMRSYRAAFERLEEEGFNGTLVVPEHCPHCGFVLKGAYCLEFKLRDESLARQVPLKEYYDLYEIAAFFRCPDGDRWDEGGFEDELHRLMKILGITDENDLRSLFERNR